VISVANPVIGDQEVEAVTAVLRSGALAQGAEVAAFEEEFSSVAVDSAACVAVNSGTSALHIALLALGVGKGDEVVVPSFTFAATANAVALTGATPVFCDIDLDSFCMSPPAVESLLSARTKAIIPVHLYGHPAEVQQLLDICDRHSILMIEDAAQAHLATYRKKPVGTWGDAGCFSFYPTKNMTSGEGGMISTQESSVERMCRLLRNQGQERRYFNEVVGLNNRMTDIHAAIGRVQLKSIREWTRQRQVNAEFFSSHLEGVITPTVAAGATHVYHQYTIRVEGLDRDRFVEELGKRGIGCGVYYPAPVHTLPSYADSGVDLPNTHVAASSCLSLPVHPALRPDELERVVESVNDLASAGA